MTIVKDVPPADLEHIAVEYMGIKRHEIKDINAAVREQTEMKKFQILEMWRNRYCGPDARAELLDILSKCRKGKASQEYMGINRHEIKDIDAAVREQTEMKKFQILEMWRDRYCGPDARAELLDILSKARKQNLISEEACQLIKQHHTSKPF